MRKLFKSRKALSPVVAAIILIAVTVAVSIAVAAWMGALTFTFMATEEMKFTGYTWTTDPVTGQPTAIDIRVKNTGTATLTIDKIEVNGKLETSWSVLVGEATLDAGNEVEVTVNPSAGFTSGTKYDFVFITSKGNRFGPYVTTAP